GWMGKVLRVDLSKSKVTVEDLVREIAKDYVGGRGLGVKYLYDEIDPAVDAYSPENKLLFVTSPLTGSGAPAANRYVVVTKSPLTGAIANSTAAGDFACSLKYAGYDMIIIEGRAKKPVYLSIEDDSVEIKDADGIWGLDSIKAVQAATSSRAKVACIGPAGEKLVRYACVMNDAGRAAGRSGVGAVMGSKNLKAVAVRGTKGVKVADRPAFYKAMEAAYTTLDYDYVEEFHQTGTPGVLALVHEFGVLPTRNFQTGVNDYTEKISGETLADTLSVRKRMGVGCPGCPVACGRVTKVDDPDFAGFGFGPEYETIGMFGSNCGVDNLAAVAKANFICNKAGMDTISTGNSIASATEMFERGLIPEADIGFPLAFGDAHAVVRLTEMIAAREGFGDVLAEGSYRMGEKYGTTEYFMGVKKQEFPSYDGRGLQGMGLGYATGPRGACHIRGEAQDLDLYGVMNWRLTADRGLEVLDPLRSDDKPPLVKDVQDWFCLIDSCGMCNFMFFLMVDEDQMRELLEAATGVDMGGYEGFMRTGERIFNIETLFNRRAGLTSKDDTLPKRMLEEPMPEGPAKGHVVRLAEMLPEYYQLRGWDEEGNISQGKREELGLA
ncbi:MAG: aldehyde ferredoxin oxidoreductase family protein, partial [Thermoleophilia bacterium]